MGGLDLAAEGAGIEVAAMCEVNPFCVSILRKRWPNVPVIDDVRKVNGETIGGAVDIVFGGFPCQDLSVARQDISQRKGLEGERSGLWFEMARVVRELRPFWVLAENVRGAVDLALDTVTENLEAAGYEVRSFVLPASACGAPHRRERLFVCAARKDVDNACRERFTEAGGLYSSVEERAEPIGKWAKIHGLQYKPLGEGRSNTGGLSLEGQLNPDWVEQLMCFPEGWTDPDCDEPGMWWGFPARERLRAWATPLASDCIGSKTGQRRSLRSDIYDLKHGKLECPQFPYEFPRVTKRTKWRVERMKALGNAVVSLQAYPLFQAIADMHEFIFGGDYDISCGCGDIRPQS